jgi:hypothetical protein
MNKAVAWTTLWGLLITYLPGTLISCTQLVTRKPQLRLWGWFKVCEGLVLMCTFAEYALQTL